jgi:hypothetical protein
MRKQYLNIQASLREAEQRFSSFDGNQADEAYDFGSAMEGEFDEYEDFSGAGGAEAVKSPAPYQVNVVNTTAGTLNAVLFGRNQFLLVANFGSDAGVTVTPSQANVTYVELLQQSAEQPFETSLLRVQSATANQVTQPLSITYKDASGQQATYDLITQSYFSAYQQQATIIDIPYRMRIDGNMNVQFSVLAGATVTITLFPAEKVNVSRGLAGRSGVQAYGTPQVNIGGFSLPARKSLTAQKLGQ